MKKAKVSNNVIRRLPRYLRKLDELALSGTDRISSAELGRQMSLTPSQIRQDFSCFGEFGQQGYGYNIQMLRDEISAILGMKRGFSVILIGVGNLGHALLENFSFIGNGFNMSAAFDISPELIGTSVNGVEILSTNNLNSFIAENPVNIAVLTVPRRNAKDAAATLCDSGVKAIWNFTNVELDLAEKDVVVEDVHFSDSLLALSYYLSESEDEKKQENEKA